MDSMLSFPLVRCRDCDSGLLQAVDVVGPLDGSSIVARYCPECECRDVVVADAFAVQVWQRRNTRLAEWMGGMAEALAGELAVEMDAGA